MIKKITPKKLIMEIRKFKKGVVKMEKIKDLYNTRLSLLGAKIGIGKIDLAINLIEELAIKNNRTILFFAFDGPSNWYTRIFLSSMLNIDFGSIEKYIEPLKGSRYHNITKINQEAYFKALESLYKSGIYMYNREFFTNGILEFIKDFKTENNLDLIVIDNLEILIKMYNCQNEENIEELLKKLEKLSYAENVPILILTSLDYKKEFIKLNLLDSFKYTQNILKYFNVISILEASYLTSKTVVYKDLYILKDNEIKKLNIEHNRETKKMHIVEIETED